MELSDSTRKYILAGIAAFVVIGIFVAMGLGKKQDATFEENEIAYSTAAHYLDEGHFEPALEIMEELETKQRNSENVNYVLALTAANAGEVEKSVRHMQRTLDINPHKVEDAIFMLQYAEILLAGEKNEEALQVLKRAENLSTPEEFPEYEERIQELINHIETSS